MAIWNVGYAAAGSALDFTTVALAQASASVNNGDTLRMHYSDATLSSVWYFSNFTVTKSLTFTFALGKNVLTAQGDSAASSTMFIIGASGVVISGMCFRGGTLPVSVAGAYTTEISNCYFDGNGTAVNVNNASAVVTVTDCHFAGGFVGVSISAGTVNTYHCTAYGCHVAGFRRIGGTFLSINCVAVFCGTCFLGTFSATSKNNASNDGTYPSTTGNVDLVSSDAKFISSMYTNTIVRGDFRVFAGSALLGAGYDVGVTTDIDGIPFAGAIPIGCSVAKELVSAGSVLTTATPAGNYVPPSVADVRPVSFGVGLTGTLANLDGTESAYTALEASRNSGVTADKILTGNSIKIANATTAGSFDEAARNSDPGEANVKLSTTYKIQNVSKTGTYNPLPTAATEPEIEAVVPGDESLTVTLAPSTGNELVPMYVRYFITPGGALSPESESLKRTGAGDIVISSLVNGTVYGVIAYHKGIIPGYASAPAFGMPDADLSDCSTISEVADAVKAELEAITFSYPLTYLRAWLPRKEMKKFVENTIYATICPRGSENVQISRSRTMKEYQIDIALQCKISSASNDLVDPMVRLSDQLAKALRNVKLVGAPDVRWAREQRQPIFSDDHAEEFALFTGVVTVFYRLDE